jgi:hypothetical protein
MALQRSDMDLAHWHCLIAAEMKLPSFSVVLGSLLPN